MNPLQTDPVVLKILITILVFLVIPTIGGTIVLAKLNRWAAELMAHAENERRDER